VENFHGLFFRKTPLQGGYSGYSRFQKA